MYCGAKTGGETPAAPPAAAPGETPPLPPLRVTSGHLRARRNWGAWAAGLVLLAGGGLALRAFLRPGGDGEADVFLVQAGDVHVWTRDLKDPCEFRFSVTALEGECAVSSGAIRAAAGVTPAEKEALDAQASVIRAGETRVLLGKCKPGPYAWAVFASRKNRARVRVGFEFK